MERINGYYFYQLGNFLKPLENLKEGTKLRDASLVVYGARIWLEWFLADKVVPLSFCKQTGGQLVAALKNLVPEIPVPEDKLDNVIGTDVLYPLVNGLREFQIVLNTELGQIDTYFISRTGIYSTPDLIERADSVLPDDVRKALPQSTLTDLKQAGRCLAFELPTAAGFHTMRAVESVLVDYYFAFVKKKPKGRNWGKYISDLKETSANEKVLAVVDQIRSLHRNPTIHPEEVLSNNQALILFGIAQSAITAMVEDIGQQAESSRKSSPQNTPSSS